MKSPPGLVFYFVTNNIILDPVVLKLIYCSVNSNIIWSRDNMYIKCVSPVEGLNDVYSKRSVMKMSQNVYMTNEDIRATIR